MAVRWRCESFVSQQRHERHLEAICGCFCSNTTSIRRARKELKSKILLQLWWLHFKWLNRSHGRKPAFYWDTHTHPHTHRDRFLCPSWATWTSCQIVMCRRWAMQSAIHSVWCCLCKEATSCEELLIPTCVLHVYISAVYMEVCVCTRWTRYITRCSHK